LTNFFTTSTKESKNSKGYLVIEDVKEEIPIKTEEKPNKENENRNETEVNPVKDFFNLKEKEITPPKKKRKQKQQQQDNTAKQGQITSFFKVTKKNLNSKRECSQ